MRSLFEYFVAGGVGIQLVRVLVQRLRCAAPIVAPLLCRAWITYWKLRYPQAADALDEAFPVRLPPEAERYWHTASFAIDVARMARATALAEQKIDTRTVGPSPRDYVPTTRFEVIRLNGRPTLIRYKQGHGTYIHVSAIRLSATPRSTGRATSSASSSPSPRRRAVQHQPLQETEH